MFKQPMQSIKKERHLPKCNIFKKKKLAIVWLGGKDQAL